MFRHLKVSATSSQTVHESLMNCGCLYADEFYAVVG